VSYVHYHPVFLALEGRSILIVGGGNVAIEKLESLLPTGARITVVSPDARPEIRQWHDDGKLEWIQRQFEDSDVEPAFMVVAATDDPELNARVFRTGDSKLRLTNSVDDPINCNFIMAAITRHGPMQVAISSAGCSPALAQRVRNRIAAEILTEELGGLAEFLGERRTEVKQALPTYKARQAFWEGVIDSEIPNILREHGPVAAESLFRERLSRAAIPAVATSPKVGKVYLVGAGPGDPGLITIRATQVLAQADVILYDRLINKVLLKYAKPSAEKIYAGKDRGSPGMPRQISLHEKLIAYAREGKTVVRLKGGDPFVFGRGGEEALALQEAGIPWEVVSGVTSSIAAPAAANIPVSHRKIAPAFGVFAGQEASDATGDGIPWQAAALMPTAIFLMGVERLPHITSQLILHGRSPDTPIAAVSNGTLPNQKVVIGTLADICSMAGDLEPPATIVVGEVVRIAESLGNVLAGLGDENLGS
jgi:uroporphyrin-III C-methyltransferase/precorrin-2 dehydrogenase/sirohydrochlorin ferrochelatase